MTNFEDQEWFVDLTADWGWLRRSYFVATWPLYFAWARLRQSWWQMWRREALRWEGVARDFAERLEAIDDTDWLNEYRTSRDENWWECWDDEGEGENDGNDREGSQDHD